MTAETAYNKLFCIPSADDVILPSTDLCFRKCILVLTVQQQKLIKLINLSIINTGDCSPSSCTAFCGRKILYSMK